MSSPSRNVPASRVLVVATETYSLRGGLQQFNRRLINILGELSADGGHFTALVMRDPPASLPRLEAGELRSVGSAAGMMRDVLLQARQADTLFIAHINLLPAALVARMINPGIRTVLMVHGVEVWNDPAYRRRRFYEPSMLRLIDRVASVSRFTAEVMEREFSVPASKFILLPNAVDRLAPSPAMERGPVVLAVSRLAPHDRGKNIGAVIRAMELVVRARPDARLEIVGDGELRAELEALAGSLGLAEHVRFLGRVDDAALARAYGRAAVFALPSSKEGFGIVFLEAWQHRLPVICGTEDAAHEIVSHGEDGFAINPRDAPLLAGWIEMLLNNPARAAQMGRSGAEKVARHYLNDNFRQNLSNLLAGLQAEAADGEARARSISP